jgi:hypothetical protein
MERGQREGRKGRKGGGRGDRQGEADRQWGLIHCSLVVGGRLCPWALAVCRHAVGRSRRWGVVASVGARVGVALGVVLVGVRGGFEGVALRPRALVFEGGCRVGGRSRRWGVVMGGFRLCGGFSFSSGGCRPWAVVLCGWGTVVGCG